MPQLIIRKRLNSPSFGVWKWTEGDHKRPLQFHLDGATARVYVEPDRIRDDEPLRDLQMVMNLRFELVRKGTLFKTFKVDITPLGYLGKVDRKGARS